MDVKNLRKIQLKQLYIAKTIDRICKKYNINYFLNAGSLLGAVRHNGFIPWDDDLDIGMLRKDYNKFLEVLNQELDEDFFIQTWDYDENYPFPFLKIRLNGTKYIEYNSRNVDIHKGIYVDIFPYDNLSNNKFSRFIQRYSSKIIIHLLLNKSGYEYSNKKIFFLIKCLSKIFSKEFLRNKLYSIMNKYNDKITEKVVTFGGANSFEKETIMYDWVSDKVLLPFEDTFLYAPKEWDKFLKHFYGDYMTPPPENQRYNRHNIIYFDLNS